MPKSQHASGLISMMSCKHLPELGQAIRFAKALNVPLAYLFYIEDDWAELIHELNEQERKQLLTNHANWYQPLRPKTRCQERYEAPAT